MTPYPSFTPQIARPEFRGKPRFQERGDILWDRPIFRPPPLEVQPRVSDNGEFAAWDPAHADRDANGPFQECWILSEKP